MRSLNKVNWQHTEVTRQWPYCHDPLIQVWPITIQITCRSVCIILWSQKHLDPCWNVLSVWMSATPSFRVSWYALQFCFPFTASRRMQKIFLLPKFHRSVSSLYSDLVGSHSSGAPLLIFTRSVPRVQVMAWCCQTTSHYLNQCCTAMMLSLDHKELNLYLHWFTVLPIGASHPNS